ncbi:MAG: hypothetical protein FWF69_01490 [Firmicutes bacterium]|nr:hypothetical protein [Bacillota bacterium]
MMKKNQTSACRICTLSRSAPQPVFKDRTYDGKETLRVRPLVPSPAEAPALPHALPWVVQPLAAKAEPAPLGQAEEVLPCAPPRGCEEEMVCEEGECGHTGQEAPECPPCECDPLERDMHAAREREKIAFPRAEDRGGVDERDAWVPHGISVHYDKAVDAYGEGLLYFQKWWFLNDIELSVGGTLLSGTPIFLRDNTLRMVDKTHSYFIPLRHVEYIKTPNGMSDY